MATQSGSQEIDDVNDRKSRDEREMEENDDLIPENSGHNRRLPGKENQRFNRQHSFRKDIEHAAAETYLITGLSFKLLSYLGVGYIWIIRLLALLCYAMLLLPGFLQVGYYYYFSSLIHRSVIYGDKPRNRLDLYLPENPYGKKPVVIFVTGGAWIIGYKAWGSLLGMQLAERDVIVACLDYRNFPQGTISEMIEDVSQGISFVCNNIAACGGDPDRIYLVGQSAGAHISTCALLEQAIRESRGETSSWSLSQIKAYFSLSGGYNLVNLADHFHNRGLYRSIFLSIMEGEDSLKKYSPELLVRNESLTKAVSLLPKFFLFHGTKDCSIPSVASEKFTDALKKAGCHVELTLYEGKGHTDLFVEDPLRGGKDPMFEQMVSIIHADDPDAQARDAMTPSMRRFVPEILVKLAARVSPF